MTGISLHYSLHYCTLIYRDHKYSKLLKRGRDRLDSGSTIRARGCESPLCTSMTEENDNGARTAARKSEESEESEESGIRNGVPRHRKIAAPLEAAVNRRRPFTGGCI